ncbi:MAG: hypothetical protein DPW18_11235 [Chloroflexi bacterium]|nr:hypothetical protein [Chloroflexota bacterium]MDL1944054.1 STAS domain-containing protein [Chloroflexi bacterium CFX2]
MADLLKITKTGGRVVILQLEGNLDRQTEDELVHAAQREFDSGARFLLMDLHGVEVVTSAGLRALHTIYKMFTPENEIQAWRAEHPHEVFKSPYFKLAQPSPQVHYVLSMAGFLQSLYIHPSAAEALASFA